MVYLRSIAQRISKFRVLLVLVPLLKRYCLRNKESLPLLFKCFASLKFILCAFVQKGPLCSDTVIGQGNTSAWKMCGFDKATTLSLIFEIVKKETSDATVQSASNQFYFQFLT